MNTISNETLAIVDAMLDKVSPVLLATVRGHSGLTKQEFAVVNYNSAILALIDEMKIVALDSRKLGESVSASIISAHNSGMLRADIEKPFKLAIVKGAPAKKQQWKINPLGATTANGQATFLSSAGQCISLCGRAKSLGVDTGTVAKPRAQSAIKKECEALKVVKPKIADSELSDGGDNGENSDEAGEDITTSFANSAPDYKRMISDAISILRASRELVDLYRNELTELLDASHVFSIPTVSIDSPRTEAKPLCMPV